jgi:hypothetical protein
MELHLEIEFESDDESNIRPGTPPPPYIESTEMMLENGHSLH